MNAATDQIGYCTNVHAGPNLDQTWANLRRHALDVKQQFRPDGAMGVGLWLAADAAGSLLDSRQLDEFSAWLADVGLVPFTLNGFPYGDFHQPVVKHRVYQPTWMDPARLQYTIDLATIQDRLLPPGVEGSISTLPVAWGTPGLDVQQRAKAGRHFRQLVEFLARLESERGRLVYVCIEPEPGCFIERCDDLIDFYHNDVLSGGDEQLIRRHLRVCHDVCHAAVMFEPQADVLARFSAAGIQIGKIQISSAVSIDFDALSPGDRLAALDQLAAFAEDRYLHQTSVRRGLASPATEFFEDLPAAIEASRQSEPNGEWRVHFHVPVYLQRFDRLGTTQDQIADCLTAAAQYSGVHHFEVETYAWSVLPAELQQQRLATGIAAEMAWFEQLLSARHRPGTNGTK